MGSYDSLFCASICNYLYDLYAFSQVACILPIPLFVEGRNRLIFLIRSYSFKKQSKFEPCGEIPGNIAGLKYKTRDSRSENRGQSIGKNVIYHQF
jgi:hypothetical protein